MSTVCISVDLPEVCNTCTESTGMRKYLFSQDYQMDQVTGIFNLEPNLWHLKCSRSKGSSCPYPDMPQAFKAEELEKDNKDVSYILANISDYSI